MFTRTGTKNCSDREDRDELGAGGVTQIHFRPVSAVNGGKGQLTHLYSKSTLNE